MVATSNAASKENRGIQLAQHDLQRALEDAALPLAGKIVAGHPIEAVPGQDTINLVDFFMRPDRFILKVKGNSMIEAGILDSDMVIIEKRDTAKDGDIVKVPPRFRSNLNPYDKTTSISFVIFPIIP